MQRKSIVIIIVGILLCIGIAVFVFLPAKNADKFTDVIDVETATSQSHIWIKKKVWGMTAEDQLILVSMSSDWEYGYDKQKELIYHGLIPFLYKIQGDTLMIYTLHTAKIPTAFRTDVQIVQHEMDSMEQRSIFEHDRYKELGLQVVSR